MFFFTKIYIIQRFSLNPESPLHAVSSLPFPMSIIYASSIKMNTPLFKNRFYDNEKFVVILFVCRSLTYFCAFATRNVCSINIFNSGFEQQQTTEIPLLYSIV